MSRAGGKRFFARILGCASALAIVIAGVVVSLGLTSAVHARAGGPAPTPAAVSSAYSYDARAASTIPAANLRDVIRVARPAPAGVKIITELRAAKAGASALGDASAAAFKAANNVDAFSVPAKHLLGAGGRWNKFASGVNPKAGIEEALRSEGAMSRPNAGTTDRFRVVTDLGRVVGSRGETAVRVVVSRDGRIITAFPVRG